MLPVFFLYYEGHLLIIPNRHVADYFAVTAEEKAELWAMVDKCKILLEERFRPETCDRNCRGKTVSEGGETRSRGI